MPLQHRRRFDQHDCVDRSRPNSLEQPRSAQKSLARRRALPLQGVLRDGLRLVEQPETADVAKLEALREAASAGASTLDRGELKGFGRIED
jgi:hypothetical protein